MDPLKAKVVLLGHGAVGKTSLVRRFVLDLFSDEYTRTVGTKVMKKELVLQDKGRDLAIAMTVWDVLGQRGYSGVQETAVKGSQSVLLVYDVTREDTWRSLEEYWIPMVWRLIGKVPLVFAANKVDLEGDRMFAKEMLSYFTQKYAGAGFLSSAKTGEGVESMFLELGKRILSTVDAPVKRLAQPTPPHKPADPFLCVTDKIMTDFCAGFGGLETGMAVVRQQFEKAGVDVRAPTKDGLLKVVDLLSQVERGVKSPEIIAQNRLRRISWARGLP